MRPKDWLRVGSSEKRLAETSLLFHLDPMEWRQAKLHAAFWYQYANFFYVILSQGYELSCFIYNSWPAFGPKLCLLFGYNNGNKKKKQKAPLHWLPQLVNYLKSGAGSAYSLLFWGCYHFTSSPCKILFIFLSSTMH